MAPRTVRQLHFLTWSDKTRPDHFLSLLSFRRKVRALQRDSTGPVVIHCRYLSLQLQISDNNLKSLNYFRLVLRIFLVELIGSFAYRSDKGKGNSLSSSLRFPPKQKANRNNL